MDICFQKPGILLFVRFQFHRVSIISHGSRDGSIFDIISSEMRPWSFRFIFWVDSQRPILFIRPIL